MRPSTSFGNFHELPNISTQDVQTDSIWKIPQVSLACFSVFADVFSCSVIISVIPAWFKDIDFFDIKYSGLMFTAYSFGLIIGTPVFGWMHKYFSTNNKIFMILGFLGIISGCIFQLLSKNLFLVVLGRFVQGFCGAVNWCCSVSLITTISEGSRLHFLMQILLATNAIGFVLGPILGGILYVYSGLGSIFYVCIGFSLIGVIFRLIVEDPEVMDFRSSNATSLAVGKTQQSLTTLTYFRIIADPVIAFSTIISLLASVVISSFIPVLPHILDSVYGFSPLYIGFIFGSLFVPNMILSSPISKIAEGYGPLKIIGMGLCINIVSCFTIGPSKNIAFIICILFAIGTSHTMTMTPLFQLNSKRTRLQNKTLVCLNASYAMGMLIGPVLGNYLYFQFGFLHLTMMQSIMLMICLFLNIFINICITQRKRNRSGNSELSISPIQVLSSKDDNRY